MLQGECASGASCGRHTRGGRGADLGQLQLAECACGQLTLLDQHLMKLGSFYLAQVKTHQFHCSTLGGEIETSLEVQSPHSHPGVYIVSTHDT